MSFLFM